MLKNNSKLNLVRIGSDITYSSLKEIGSGILTSFHGIINEIDLAHYESPIIDSIDAQLLTLILGEEYIGNTLGITDADLKIDDGDEFYNSILGGKNPQNDVAVVSTKKLAPANMFSEAEIDSISGSNIPFHSQLPGDWIEFSVEGFETCNHISKFKSRVENLFLGNEWEELIKINCADPQSRIVIRVD